MRRLPQMLLLILLNLLLALLPTKLFNLTLTQTKPLLMLPSLPCKPMTRPKTQ